MATIPVSIQPASTQGTLGTLGVRLFPELKLYAGLERCWLSGDESAWWTISGGN